ncbi:AAA family ATPase [Bordetella sp. FB-8]|nr:AAA family ATPase [Bordetella sp. FB-8]
MSDPLASWRIVAEPYYAPVGRWLLDADGTRWQDGPLTFAARPAHRGA